MKIEKDAPNSVLKYKKPYITISGKKIYIPEIGSKPTGKGFIEIGSDPKLTEEYVEKLTKEIYNKEG